MHSTMASYVVRRLVEAIIITITLQSFFKQYILAYNISTTLSFK